MSGFSGGMGNMVGDLIRQAQSQSNAQSGQTPATAPPAQGVTGGPGEPTQGGQYGQQGTYNTLAQDMSRGFMGNYGFNGGMFGYQPYGNPYAQQSPFGRFGGGFRGGYGGGYGGYDGGYGGYGGGYGGGWGGPPPPIMGGGRYRMY